MRHKIGETKRKTAFAINLQNRITYLTNPAAIRKLMKRAKPDQTPGRPKIEGAYSKNADDIAPTNI